MINELKEGQMTFQHWVEYCQNDSRLTQQVPAAQISDWFHALFDGMILWPLIIGLKAEWPEAERDLFIHKISESFIKVFKFTKNI